MKCSTGWLTRPRQGLDITKLRRRPGRPAMGSGPADSFPVRLEPELRHALDERAAAGRDDRVGDRA